LISVGSRLIMPTVNLELSQLQYNKCLTISKMLNREGIIEEPAIEELLEITLKIMIEEYNSNSQSLLEYFKKRKS
jgi:hypothetical protein